MLRRLSPSLLVLLPACWSTTGNSELGLTALMRITAPSSAALIKGGVPPPGAQFFAGPMPKPSTGPKVTDVDSLINIIYPGEQNRSVSGRVATGAVVVAIGLQGDSGYWVLPVGTEDFQYPGEADFAATAEFSSNLGIGSQTIHFEAGDDSGHFGPSNDQVIQSKNVDAPRGYLIVHLTWDTNADLDLHVQDPSGDEIWAKAETTFTAPAPGSPPPTQDQILNAGILQFDSNGQCVIDGLRNENAYWSKSVPPGVFTVRVDAWSMCGQQYAAWTIQVERRTDLTTPGPIIATAQGTLYPRDALGPHVGGSGAFALNFTINPEENADAGP